jgi:hypothetical protein
MSEDQGQVTGQVEVTVPGPRDTTRALVGLQFADAAGSWELAGRVAADAPENGDIEIAL